jgi:hypothetical protein
LASRGAIALAAVVAALVLSAIAGCGESGGVEEGATVTAYVVAPLCPEAKQALAGKGAEAGSVRVRAVCLPPARSGGGLDLAAIGAGARRATGDSSSIAYIEPPDPAAARFSETILESAGVPSIVENSGAAAISRLRKALSEADLSSLRDSVSDELR